MEVSNTKIPDCFNWDYYFNISVQCQVGNNFFLVFDCSESKVRRLCTWYLLELDKSANTAFIKTSYFMMNIK